MTDLRSISEPWLRESQWSTFSLQATCLLTIGFFLTAVAPLLVVLMQLASFPCWFMVSFLRGVGS